MIEATDIEQMSVEDRLRTMELLWASLICAPEAVPSPSWHETVLRERLAKIRRGEGRFLTLDELKSTLEDDAG